MSSEQPTCGWCGEKSMRCRLGQVVKWTHGIDDKVDGVLADKVKLDERVSALEAVTQADAATVAQYRKAIRDDLDLLEARVVALDKWTNGCATDMAQFDVDLREMLESLTKLHGGQIRECIGESLYQAIHERVSALEVVTQELRGKVPATMIPLGRQEFESVAGRLQELSKSWEVRLRRLEDNWAPAPAGAALTSMAEGLSRRLDALENTTVQHRNAIRDDLVRLEAYMAKFDVDLREMGARVTALENGKEDAGVVVQYRKDLEARSCAEAIAGGPGFVDFVFDGDETINNQIVKVEDHQGRSIRMGVWVRRTDGLWALRIPDPRRGTTEP